MVSDRDCSRLTGKNEGESLNEGNSALPWITVTCHEPLLMLFASADLRPLVEQCSRMKSHYQKAPC
jgi:hypothetical protein